MLFRSLVIGTIVMTIFGVVMNYFVNIPFYTNVMGLDMNAIISMTSAVGNSLVTDMRTLLLFVFVPFNIFKGIVISLIVMAIYKKLSPILHK